MRLKLKRRYTVALLSATVVMATSSMRAIGQEQKDPEVPMTVTERAYTSPIWYSPGS